MTTPDLRERVARAICARLNMHFDYIGEKLQAKYLAEADAAIALVLEEAAKVADELKVKYPMDDGDYGHNGALEEAVAAIRALKDT